MSQGTATMIAEAADERLSEAIDWVANHGNPHRSGDPAKPWGREVCTMKNLGLITPWTGGSDLDGYPTPLIYEVHAELVRLGKCDPIGTPKPF
jgi:hypothetical protein